tara:strand:+ start:2590 stop:2802 length:213 start_codon:yes stop_codon:yes gene_type:complete
MKYFEKLHYETMEFDELETRLKIKSDHIHRRQTALDKEKNDLDIILGIYVQRVQQDDELKKAAKSTMKSL